MTDRELSAFAAQVGEEGPVAVEGGRTRWSTGGAPAVETRLLRAPNGVIDHCREEMTVRVRAGTSVAELHQVLHAGGQRTALPERGGTVGGALAVGENCVSVLGRGRVRDCVLQVRYVSAEGRIITGGAPTVKNVSGFDLPKLMVGSLGTLGLIGEVVLRTNPIPPAAEWWTAAGANPFEVWQTLARPSAILWDGQRTWVELEGHAADVEAKANVLRQRGSWVRAEGPPPLPARRWSLRPADLACLDAGTTGEFVASIGVGSLWADRPQNKRLPSEGIQTLSKRLKAAFDPDGRLNPGRDPLGVS